MEVDVAVYFFWPKGKNLIKSFQRAPTPTGNMKEDTEIYTAFEPGINDGVRAILGQHTDEEIRKMTVEKGKAAEIEEEIRNFFVEEAGNPFREAAIPKNKIDVTIRVVKFTEAVKKAFSAEEVGRREGRGE